MSVLLGALAVLLAVALRFNLKNFPDADRSALWMAFVGSIICMAICFSLGLTP